jgi:hypothetical protein
MALNLERISWMGQYYVNLKGNKVDPKPIGDAIIDTDLVRYPDTQNKAEGHLLELQTKNKIYNKVNAYTVAYQNEYSGDKFIFTVSFYKI